MAHAGYSLRDVDHSPLMFYYEVTQACDLVCKHCRASAQETAHPEQLSTVASRALIDQIASFPRLPTLVFTGGDPLKRPDLFDLIHHAVALGIECALTPSATPLADFEAFRRARDAGVRCLGISLDGADAEVHDSFRGWSGSFSRTLEMLGNAADLNLPVQVNTSITRRNVGQVDAIAELLTGFRTVFMWSVFFLVPVGRGLTEERIAPAEYEDVFAKLWHHAQTKPFAVKTTEAPHYRRFVLERGGSPIGTKESNDESVGHRGAHRGPLGIGDGKGVMFVNHLGEIYPAGFLPFCCGRFPENSVVEVYQQHPVFVALRRPDCFRGRCGICEYRYVCGGSRARAFALTGDYLASDPDCVYIPRATAIFQELSPAGDQTCATGFLQTGED